MKRFSAGDMVVLGHRLTGSVQLWDRDHEEVDWVRVRPDTLAMVLSDPDAPHLNVRYVEVLTPFGTGWVSAKEVKAWDQEAGARGSQA